MLVRDPEDADRPLRAFDRQHVRTRPQGQRDAALSGREALIDQTPLGRGVEHTQLVARSDRDEPLATRLALDGDDRRRAYRKTPDRTQGHAAALVAHRKPLPDPARTLSRQQGLRARQVLNAGEVFAGGDQPYTPERLRRLGPADVIQGRFPFERRHRQQPLRLIDEQTDEPAVETGDRRSGQRKPFFLIEKTALASDRQQCDIATRRRGGEGRGGFTMPERQRRDRSRRIEHREGFLTQRVFDPRLDPALAIRLVDRGVRDAEDQDTAIVEPGRKQIRTGLGRHHTGEAAPRGHRERLLADERAIPRRVETDLAALDDPGQDVTVLVHTEPDRGGARLRPGETRHTRHAGRAEQRPDHTEQVEEDQQQGDQRRHATPRDQHTREPVAEMTEPAQARGALGFVAGSRRHVERKSPP